MVHSDHVRDSGLTRTYNCITTFGKGEYCLQD